MSDGLAYGIAGISVLGFVGLWLVITFAMTRLTPWHELEGLFPDHSNARSLGTLRFQGAYLGRGNLGASFRGCLTFTVTEKGLRIAIWKVFMPFANPIFIPWGKMQIEPTKVMLFFAVRMKVGPRGQIWITIAKSAADQISRLSGGRFPPRTDAG